MMVCMPYLRLACEHLVGSIVSKQTTFLFPAQSLAYDGEQSMLGELNWT